MDKRLPDINLDLPRPLKHANDDSSDFGAYMGASEESEGAVPQCNVFKPISSEVKKNTPRPFYYSDKKTQQMPDTELQPSHPAKNKTISECAYLGTVSTEM